MSKAEIGLGCVTFGREIGQRESFALLDSAREHGVVMLDTAAGYSGGASEKILGEWLISRSPSDDTIEVATKILPPFEPQSIAERVEESRDRLGVSKIDLLYLHSWDSSAEQFDVMEALDGLVCSGVVSQLGVSNVKMETLRRVREMQEQHSLAPFSVVQNNFNYAVRDLDEKERQQCSELGIRVVTYSPLGAGFLTGKHRDGVEKGSRFDVIPGHQDVYFHEQSWKRLDRLEEVAKAHGHSQAHLALAWVFHQPNIDCVLIGGRKIEHLNQAVKARDEDGEVLKEL